MALGAAAGAVGRLLRVDVLLGQGGEGPVEVVDGEGDVVVAGSEVVGVDAVVVGQLQPRVSPCSAMKTLIASSPIGIRRTSSKPSFS